jgi:hypothetical protein
MNRLLHLETIIETERRCFYKIGKALKEVRDERLYRQLLFDSFKSYLKQRWDMSRSQGYRLIEAARIIDNLSPIGEKLPENEAQLRPLIHLSPSDQCKIWRDFLATGTELKARNIRRFVLTYMSCEKKGIDQSELISVDYKNAVMAMLKEITLARQDGWQNTSRDAGLFWLRVMKEKIVSKD